MYNITIAINKNILFIYNAIIYLSTFEMYNDIKIKLN